MDKILDILSKKGFKLTVQRKIILDSIINSKEHPSVDQIIKSVKREYPNISQGTIYNTLDLFYETGIISKLKTEQDKLRYDPVTERHHHIFHSDSDKIEDYYDDDLNRLLDNYFRNKKIKNFKIEDFKLQITGKYNQLKQ